MRIVLLSGLDERTPPTNYGSVETLVYCAARELTALGHEVIVFATEDSAESLSFCEFRAYPLTRGVRHASHTQEEADALKLRAMRRVLKEALELQPDVIHNNEYTGLVAWSEFLRKPSNIITTAHWPFDDTVTSPAFRMAHRHKTLMVSRAQERLARSMRFELAYLGVVHNCIAPERFIPEGVVHKTERLAWVGRFDPMKGIEEAVAIARLLDRPLAVAGKVDNYTKPYFTNVVEPLLKANTGLVEFLGEVSQLEASRLIASSYAFLMTTKFYESCPLTPMESLAAGTPVVSTDRGAMPEIIQHGVSGFIIPMRGSDIDIVRFAANVRACANIRYDICRASAERFRPAHMARGYEAAYVSLAESRKRRSASSL